MSEKINELVKNLKLLVLDVDGVLTDGILHYNADGKIEKNFHVQDGFAVMLLQSMGVKVAVVTAGQDGLCVAKRVERLKVKDFFEGNMKKEEAMHTLKERYNLDWSEMAFVGDDWVDLIPLNLVGVKFAVANACEEVKEIADYVTKLNGGAGAVREIIMLILKAQGLYDKAFKEWSIPNKK